jgi:hypothetical protein
MSRLMVQRGKKNLPFHPRMFIRNTGYAKHHICVIFFRPDVEIGLGTMREYVSIEIAAKHYLSELKRCGHYKV